MGQRAKHIVLAIRLAGEPGRQKLRGVYRYISEHHLNWHLELIRADDDISVEYVASLAGRKVDGIVYSLPRAKDCSAALSRLAIPTVTIDVFDAPALERRTRNLVTIRSDSEAIGRAAAHHLITLGTCRSYAFVPDRSMAVWSRLRGEGFLHELKRSRLHSSVYRTRVKGYDLPHLTEWLKGLPKPVGVFAAFDGRAVAVLEACFAAGLRVPDDVAVIGVDNDELICNHTTPPLTSIQPDHEYAGYLAAERLDALMNALRLQQSESRLIGIKALVERNSTGDIASAGRLVQRALAYIRDNAHAPISARDVVAHLKVSRRLADLRFRELQGSSIGEAILNFKLDGVARQLRETTLPLADVAAQYGFPRLCRLKDRFKRRYGVSMTDYRSDHLTPANPPRDRRQAR